MTKAVIRSGVAPQAVLVAVLAAALSGQGQAARADDGVELTFGVGLRLTSDSNPTLVPVSPGSRTTTALDLSFGLTKVTARSTLSLQVTSGLANATGAGAIGTAGVNGLNNSGLTLSYALTSGTADVTLDGTLNTVNLGQTGDVTDFQTGAGQRRTGTLTTGISWGKDAPFGAGLTAGLTDISYPDNPAGLLASRDVQLGANAHTDLSPVLHLGFGVHDSRFSQDGVPTQDTPGLDASLTLDRKTGSFVASLTTDNSPQGQRTTLDFQHQITLPAGTLSYSLGATRSATAKTYAIGALTYQQDLALGTLNLGLNRAVQANAYTNAETLVSSANAGFTHAISPRASLSLALNWAEQRSTASTAAITNTSLQATWTQALTADWALDFGYTRYLRDQDQIGPLPSLHGQSDSVFVTLHRNFSVRY